MTQFIYSTIVVNGREVGVRRAAPEAPPPPPVDYSEMTKAGLITLAEERSLDVTSRMSKSKIIDALKGSV
jgi:hypothetical protein